MIGLLSCAATGRCSHVTVDHLGSKSGIIWLSRKSPPFCVRDRAKENKREKGIYLVIP